MLLLVLLLRLLLLLLLTDCDEEFTPGGVDNNKSGTTGDGEVIELKFENAVDADTDGDGAAIGI